METIRNLKQSPLMIFTLILIIGDGQSVAVYNPSFELFSTSQHVKV